MSTANEVSSVHCYVDKRNVCEERNAVVLVPSIVA